jgi:hypothetical protein
LLLDVAFIKRVYKTSVWVWLFILLWCAALRSLPLAVGVSVGFGISLGSLALLERLVTALVVPAETGRSRRVVRKLLAVAAAKYAVIALILSLALKLAWASPIGLAIGIGLPQAVIFLKALGTVLTFAPELDGRF